MYLRIKQFAIDAALMPVIHRRYLLRLVTTFVTVVGLLPTPL